MGPCGGTPRLTVGGYFLRAEQEHLIARDHVLIVCEGGRSRTREHYADRFGTADASSLDGEHIQDVVLGLRVKSRLSDPMSVLLTVAQKRFLLNSLCGEGFLDMRLTREEARNVIGIDPVRQVFEECVAARPCVMSRHEDDEFVCPTHGTLFLPALLRGSPRSSPGRPPIARGRTGSSWATRPKRSTSGPVAASTAVWPRPFRSFAPSAASGGAGRCAADFIRHEAAMSMLRYRHKSRAWNAMVTTDERGVTRAIKDVIESSLESTAGRAAAAPAASSAPAPGVAAGPVPLGSAEPDVEILLDRMWTIRDRLATRLPGLPDDEELRAHLSTLAPATLWTLQESGAWDALIVGGEEADIDIFYQNDAPVCVPAAPGASAVPAAPAVPTAPVAAGPPPDPRTSGLLDPA